MEIQSPKKPIHQKRCKLGRVVDELDGKNKSQLIELIDSDISARRLSLILLNASFSIHHTTIYEHRLGICACARS